MKYTPQENKKIQTSCKNCVFAEYDHSTQTGCKANRLSFFETIEAYDLEKEFYVINGFCNLYRNQKWNCGLPDIQKALNESSLDFDILFNYDEISKHFENYINNTISKIDYNSNKLSIVLFCSYFNGKEATIKMLNTQSINPNAVVSSCVDKQSFLNEHILNSKKACHCYVTNDKLDPAIFNELNNYVNLDLKKFAVVNHNNNLIVSNMAYRLNYYSSKIYGYNDNINDLVNKAKTTNMYIEL